MLSFNVHEGTRKFDITPVEGVRVPGEQMVGVAIAVGDLASNSTFVSVSGRPSVTGTLGPEVTPHMALEQLGSLYGPMVLKVLPEGSE